MSREKAESFGGKCKVLRANFKKIGGRSLENCRRTVDTYGETFKKRPRQDQRKVQSSSRESNPEEGSENVGRKIE